MSLIRSAMSGLVLRTSSASWPSAASNTSKPASRKVSTATSRTMVSSSATRTLVVPCRSASVFIGRFRLLWHWKSHRVTGHENGDGRALSHFTFDIEIAVRLPDVTKAYAQSQTSTLSLRLCREKGVDGLGQHLLRHSGSGIAHGQADVLPRGSALVIGSGFLHVHVRGFDEEPAAGGHGIPGVDRQIDQHILHLVRIAQGPPVGVETAYDLYLVTHRVP